jgi:hypothetical protein
MGFDVHGLRPKINKKLDDTTIYGMIEAIPSHQDRWTMMDNLSKEDKKKYWKEHEQHHDDNPGLYFRNNVWWWRPLWIFVCDHCEDVMSDSNMRGGTYNDGHKINKETAINISNRLMKLIDDGTVDKYSDFYEKERKKAEKSDDKDAQYMANYPFATDNVKRFAVFCKESGGFQIC